MLLWSCYSNLISSSCDGLPSLCYGRLGVLCYWIVGWINYTFVFIFGCRKFSCSEKQKINPVIWIQHHLFSTKDLWNRALQYLLPSFLILHTNPSIAAGFETKLCPFRPSLLFFSRSLSRPAFLTFVLRGPNECYFGVVICIHC